MFIARRVGACAVAISLAGLVGCASQSNSPTTLTPETVVAKRAQERWDALLVQQFDKAYEYITPGGRETLPKSVFVGRLATAKWLDAKVVKVVCESEVCDVSVRLEFNLLPNLKHSDVFYEKWILEGGNWWFVYRG